MPDDSPPDVTIDKPRSAETKEETKQELREAIQGSHEVVVTATTVFPFTLFPDTVTVDRTKLTITKRAFIGVAEVMSIRIEDILNVTVNVGPLFGSLHVVSRVLSPDKPYEIYYLWRGDAMNLKRVLQGYIIAMQKEIDVSPLSIEELRKMLTDLGKDDHPNGN